MIYTSILILTNGCRLQRVWPRGYFNIRISFSCVELNFLVAVIIERAVTPKRRKTTEPGTQKQQRRQSPGNARDCDKENHQQSGVQVSHQNLILTDAGTDAHDLSDQIRFWLILICL